jgi:hypothetical protein
MPAFQLSARFRRRARTAALTVALAAIAGGCGDDPIGNAGSLPGTYKLTSVDGRSLPLFVDCGDEGDPASCAASQPDWERLDEATIVLTGSESAGDALISLVYTDRFSGGAPEQSPPITVTGTYEAAGELVTFQSATFGSGLTLTHTGNQLRATLNLDGDEDPDEIVFRKQQ